MLTATLLLALGVTCPGLPNSTGVPARLSASLTEAGDVVDLLTEDMQPGNRAIVFYGTLPMSPVPWGQGELCLHPLYTFRGPSSVATNDGRTLDTLDLQHLPVGTVYFQTLYRDYGGRTFNLSNLDELGVSAATNFGQQLSVNLGVFGPQTTSQNLGTFCTSASQFTASYSFDFSYGESIQNEWTSGKDFDFFTQGGNDIALEYQHWWDFNDTVIRIAGTCGNGWDSCFNSPPWDTVRVGLDFKVGSFWTRKYVEFWNPLTSTWQDPLDQQALLFSYGGGSWIAARFDSVSGASKVRLVIESWEGHDSYGWGVRPDCTDPNTTLWVTTDYLRHVLTIRKP